MASLSAFALVGPTAVAPTATAAGRRCLLVARSVEKVRCSMEGKAQECRSKLGFSAAAAAAVAVMAAGVSSPAAMALVDERMSTEGTGLPFGLSNNLLIWILAVVFALIWALYSVYTTTLDEDEDSALSL